MVDFQPYYVWNPRHLEDLRVGSAIIKEALEREMVREERAARQKAEEKAAHEAAVGKVRAIFAPIVFYWIPMRPTRVSPGAAGEASLLR